MNPGCYTALVTPFSDDGSQVDRDGLQKLAAFQIDSVGLSPVVPTARIAASPVSWRWAPPERARRWPGRSIMKSSAASQN